MPKIYRDIQTPSITIGKAELGVLTVHYEVTFDIEDYGEDFDGNRGREIYLSHLESIDIYQRALDVTRMINHHFPTVFSDIEDLVEKDIENYLLEHANGGI